MTEENTGTPEDIDYGEVAASDNGGPAMALAYSNGHPPLPEARISINFIPGRAPQVTVRGQTAAEVTAVLNELASYGVYANMAAAQADLTAQGPVGDGLGPVSAVAPPPPVQPQAPQLPQSVQQVAAAYPTPAPTPPAGPQGPPPAWAAPASAPPPSYGGGGGGQQSNSRDPKPRPGGWMQCEVPWEKKDAFKAMRAQGTESGNYLRGKVQWGGSGTYWVEPSVAQWVAQQGYPVTQ